jgi:glyoxylase-like metal-dependent hydrolase (beta-lactamase superfamily II)
LTLVAHVLRTRQRDGLDLLLNTHLHSDHCGANAALQQRYHCRTLIPAGEADAVRHWDEAALSYRATGQQCPRFGFDGVIGHGQTLRLGELDWQSLAAPGHDPHSVMLYCAAEGILISADALWNNGFGVIFPELDGEPGFDDVRATLELIATLDARLVIPGHGAPFHDVEPALARAFSRLDYLQADPLRNAQNGVKVLLKFLLLERQRIALAELPALMREIPLLRMANARLLQMSDEALATWAASQLERAGAARRAGDALLDA